MKNRLTATLALVLLLSGGCDRAREFVHEQTAPTAAAPPPVADVAVAPPAPDVTAPPEVAAVPPPPPPPAPVVAPAPPPDPPRATRPLEPLTVRARLALAEVGLALAEDAVAEEDGALRVTLEASNATEYDRQLLMQWALCFGTLGPLAEHSVRIVNTIGGRPAVSVVATREDIAALADGTLDEGSFFAQMKITRLLPPPSPEPPAEAAPVVHHKPTAPAQQRPSPVRQAPRSMRAPSSYRTR